MSMPFDATLKDLAREHPEAFLAAFDGPPAAPLRLLNVDLSTVTTAADLIVGLGDSVREIVHIDFQSAAAADKHADLLVYNALLFRHYRVPVHTIIVLLRPQAAHANLDGLVDYAARPGRGRMSFGFEVVRLWERSAEELLAGAVAAAPLALLGRLPEGTEVVEGLTGIAQRVVERLDREAPREQVPKLLTAAWLLTGLRVRRDLARDIFRGVRAMRDSDIFMAIIDEGREQEAKRIILRLGQKRFGPPDEAIKTRLQAITDIDLLERLSDELLDASSWSDLLGRA
jgi:hypothetical protein